MRVCVVYALPLEQHEIELELPEGARVGDAIARSGIRERCPELSGIVLDLGLWGKPVGEDAPLRDSDRVEIYRPLQADPKEARRRRAVKVKRI